MIRVSCDLCGKELQPGSDHSYIVKIEVFPLRDPAELTEADLDEDHLEAVSQMLRDVEESSECPNPAAPEKKFRYDLCAECKDKFVRDPLGRETAPTLDFSEN
jgi:hypothetical protein